MVHRKKKNRPALHSIKKRSSFRFWSKCNTMLERLSYTYLYGIFQTNRTEKIITYTFRRDCLVYIEWISWNAQFLGYPSCLVICLWWSVLFHTFVSVDLAIFYFFVIFFCEKVYKTSLNTIVVECYSFWTVESPILGSIRSKMTLKIVENHRLYFFFWKTDQVRSKHGKLSDLWKKTCW